MTERIFHVEITYRKTIEVKVAPGDIPEDEDVQEWVIEEALQNSHDERCVVDDDYEIETVREKTAKEAA